jgi:putative ABC transport system substrate-binding protein
MRRREFIRLLGGATAVWPLGARAQQSTVPVVGFLSSVAPGPFVGEIAANRQGLAAAGYVEDRDLKVEYRWANNQLTRLPALAAELVEIPVSVLITTDGEVTARAAKAVTTTIPVVFVLGGDPVKIGLVQSLSRPGGNMTGATFFSSILAAKRLELLHHMLPKAKVIGVLIQSDNRNSVDRLQELQNGARDLGVQLVSLTANTEFDLAVAFARLTELRVEALLITAAALFTNQREQIVALAAQYKMPTVYPRHEYVEAGGLASYGTRVFDSYRQAGVYAGRILKGEKPAELPVMQPTTFELFINLKTAKALAFEIPPSVLALADQVIE